MQKLITIDLRSQKLSWRRQFPWAALSPANVASPWQPFQIKYDPAPDVLPPVQGQTERNRRPYPAGLYSGFTPPVVTWQPFRIKQDSAPDVLPPVQGQTEPNKRPYPAGLYPGFTPPFLTQLITWDNKATQQTKKHELLVATILNSLIRRGKITQISQSEWDIPGIGSTGATGSTGSTGPAGPAGTTYQNNESLASVLTNATSAGDAGGRSDQFTGNALSPRWSKDGSALTPTVGYSSCAFVSNDADCFVQTYTPTGACRVECRIMALTNPARLMIHDSSSTAGGDGMAVQMEGNRAIMYSQDSGSFTARGSLFSISTLIGEWWNYLALAVDGSNNWTGYYSPDRVNWVSLGTYNKSFTVGKIGFGADRSGTYISVDFVDVVL
jgi:hypothetical protein